MKFDKYSPVNIYGNWAEEGEMSQAFNFGGMPGGKCPTPYSIP